MFTPKSPCTTCTREDRDHCAASCPELALYRRALDVMDPDEAARARRTRVLDMGMDGLTGLAAGQDRSM